MSPLSLVGIKIKYYSVILPLLSLWVKWLIGGSQRLNEVYQYTLGAEATRGLLLTALVTGNGEDRLSRW